MCMVRNLKLEQSWDKLSPISPRSIKHLLSVPQQCQRRSENRGRWVIGVHHVSSGAKLGAI